VHTPQEARAIKSVSRARLLGPRGDCRKKPDLSLPRDCDPFPHRDRFIPPFNFAGPDGNPQGFNVELGAQDVR